MNEDPLFDTAAEPDRLPDFIAELEANGFERVGVAEWRGPTRQSLIDGGHTDSPTMTIIIRPSWPYLPPLISVPGISAWHADQERLCIWHAEDNSQRWVTLHGLNARIDEWAAHAKGGFAVVENARNPEIYWQEETAGAVFGLVDLEDLLEGRPGDGQHGEFHFADAVSLDGRPSPIVVFDLRPGAFTPMTEVPYGIETYRDVRGRWFYRSSVEHPPRTLSELRDFLTEKQRERLDKDLRDRPLVMFGLLWRNQAGLVATVLLSRPEQGGGRSHWLVILRPKGTNALLLRAGRDARILQQKRVAVLGVGAIGSNVVDQLARAGVGELHLLDHDRLWPANLIRHAAPPGTPAGTLKTVASKENLELFPWVKIQVPENPADGIVWTLDRLRGVLEAADLTIDATGHAGFAELVARVAHDLSRPCLSVALFRGGAIARVRRQAHKDDIPFLRRPHLDAYPEIPPMEEEVEYIGTETGCLAQVHNAPPTSVIHAAVLASEVAIDHLTQRHEHPDEIIEVMRLGDPPFDRLGRLSRHDLPAIVDVTEAAQRSMQAAARAAAPKETGGTLIGTVIDGRPIVVDAVELHDPEATDIAYRVAAGATSGAVAEARKRDDRLGYLGEWHSHPSGATPSVRDIATMLVAALDSGTREPILVLVHPHESGLGELSAYVTTSAGLKRATMCSTGDLPPAEEQA